MSPHRITDAVILTGTDLDVVAYAIRVTQERRRRDGQPAHPALAAIADACQPRYSPPMGVCPQPAVRLAPGLHSVHAPSDGPFLEVREVAALLGRSTRTVRRLAPQLDGVRIGGRWLIPAGAVAEHAKGGTS